MILATKVKMWLTGVIVMLIGAFTWSILPENVHTPPWTDDGERIVHMYVRSTWRAVHIHATGKSRVRGELVGYDDTTKPPWSREVVLRRGETATFDVVANIQANADKPYAVDCQIIVNGVEESAEHETTTTHVPRGAVFCHHTVIG